MEQAKRSRRRERRRQAARLADLSTIGLVFPVATVLGYLGGRLVGGWLGDAAVGALIGGALGIVAGFYNLFKVARRLAREDEAEAGAEGAGGQGSGRLGSRTQDSNEVGRGGADGPG